MANPASPFGLLPVGNLLRTRHYYVPATDSNGAIFVGDVVKTAGGSAGANTGAPGAQTVTKGTAGDTTEILGSVVGIIPETRDTTKTWRANSTAAVLIVADHPDQEFIVRSAGTVGAGDIGYNANLDVGTAGDTNTGRSGMQVSATEEADIDNQFKILRFRAGPDDDITAANQVVVITINKHALRSNVAGG